MLSLHTRPRISPRGLILVLTWMKAVPRSRCCSNSILMSFNTPWAWRRGECVWACFRLNVYCCAYARRFERVCTVTYLRAVEARQQPLVSGAAVVYLSDLSQSMEVGVHSEVVGLAEARNNDLIVQVTLFVHWHPGVTRGTSSYCWRHEGAGQRSGQFWKKEKWFSEVSIQDWTVQNIWKAISHVPMYIPISITNPHPYPITPSLALFPPLLSSIRTMSGCLQAIVEQGPNLPPQLPLLVVCRGHVDEQLVLQQHVDVSGLQATPAALRLARDLVVLRRQVIQHRALVSPPWLQLDREANKVTGETCDLNLEEGDKGGNVTSLGCLSLTFERH